MEASAVGKTFQMASAWPHACVCVDECCPRRSWMSANKGSFKGVRAACELLWCACCIAGTHPRRPAAALAVHVQQPTSEHECVHRVWLGVTNE